VVDEDILRDNMPETPSDNADELLAALLLITEGTAGVTGTRFFELLVAHVAKATATHHAFIAEFSPDRRIRTVAFWSHSQLVPNIEFDLAGTPCEEVIDGGLCFYPRGLEEKYAEREPGIQSYLGMPLKAQDERVLGHLCVYSELPIGNAAHALAIFKIFASRAAHELERMRLERDLQEKEAELEDLFEEAPVAYVHEDLDTRFFRANRAARTILGITAEEVPHTTGMSLLVDTAEARDTVRNALNRLREGTQDGGTVLQLRRKDTGQPIWIRWWSRLGKGGDYTRSMFIDITDRVMLEQAQLRLEAQNTYLREEINSVHNFEEIIGAHGGLSTVMEQVRNVACTNASVLITGESGTGKELIARALHSASDRRDKPFIKVNCAALPGSLIESELFGHERGAFTGAIQRRIGRFELANTGTIFLDEIGEMPLDMQAKLLRVLQEREFERIGGSQTIKTDVRVIAATNRDLHKSMTDGAFRSDLFYRLNVFPIAMPPLRQRHSDIPLLTHFFVQKHAPQVGRRIESIDPDSMRRLIQHTWPGNIRELENVVQRAMIMNKSNALKINSELLPEPDEAGKDASQTPPFDPTLNVGDDLNKIQRDHIVTILREVNWVIEGKSGAAARLGMKPGTLRHRMQKLGIARGT
jgi:formate hydrogenlyase transcriptional activator